MGIWRVILVTLVEDDETTRRKFKISFDGWAEEFNETVELDAIRHPVDPLEFRFLTSILQYSWPSTHFFYFRPDNFTI
jgi:hypothetical protein